MIRFVANTLHPERYQGARRGYPYFEGWYYKLVDVTEQHRLAWLVYYTWKRVLFVPDLACPAPREA